MRNYSLKYDCRNIEGGGGVAVKATSCHWILLLSNLGAAICDCGLVNDPADRNPGHRYLCARGVSSYRDLGGSMRLRTVFHGDL